VEEKPHPTIGSVAAQGKDIVANKKTGPEARSQLRGKKSPRKGEMMGGGKVKFLLHNKRRWETKTPNHKGSMKIREL